MSGPVRIFLGVLIVLGLLALVGLAGLNQGYQKLRGKA